MRRLSADGEAEAEVSQTEHGEESLQRKPESGIGLSEHAQNKRDGDDCAQGCSALLKPACQHRRPCRMCPAPQIEAPNLVHFVRLVRLLGKRLIGFPTAGRGIEEPLIHLLNPAVQWDRWPPA